MRKNRVVATVSLLCLFLALFLAGGCNGDSGEPADGAVKMINYTDSAGREVEIPAEIDKVVPSGTMAQIVLFSLAPDKLVGLAEKWNPAAGQYLDDKYLSLPVLGQFYGGKGNHNLEEIARVGPQLIIDVGEPKSSIVEDMDLITAQVEIPAVHLTATLETMGDAYRELGKLLGMEKEAAVLADDCDEVYGQTKALAESIGEGKTSLLYCSGDDGLSVIARGSFHAELVDLLGHNVAVMDNVTSKGTGNLVDLEQLVLWDPDVIIFAPDSVYSSVADDQAWQEISAVREGRYYEVPANPYNWMGFPPSVNRYLGMVWLAQLLYPEEAGDDFRAEISRYYELFYHCALTEEQFHDLLADSLLRD